MADTADLATVEMLIPMRRDAVSPDKLARGRIYCLAAPGPLEAGDYRLLGWTEHADGFLLRVTPAGSPRDPWRVSL